MPGGRPTKLTPELQNKLCAAIAEGNYYEAACGSADLNYRTFRLWMKRGKRAKQGKFFQFFQSVKKAEAEAETRVVSQWQKHMPENWQACRDFLARRHAKRWGPQDSLELKGNKKQPLRVVMSDDEFDSLPLADRIRLLQEEMEAQDTPDKPASAGT